MRRPSIAAVMAFAMVMTLLVLPAPAHAATSYYINLPEGFYAARRPGNWRNGIAIIAMHGRYGSWRDMSRALSALADRYGFLAIYPQARNGSWNAGRCCPPATTLGQDDAGFIYRVALDAQRRFRIRSFRLFGFSNGGMLAEEAVCRRPWLASRIGVMAGSPTPLTTCSWSGWALVLHGRLDSYVPWQGGYREWCQCTFRHWLLTKRVFPKARVAGYLLATTGHSAGWPAGTYERFVKFLIT